MKEYLTREFEIIHKLTKCADPVVREALLRELEEMPVDKCCFYERWERMYCVDVFHCWTEFEYDSTLSQWPRDIQLLWATDFGKSDIDNGGLHQFFGNGTGAVAPEMKEWLERSGFRRAAEVLKDAMSFFGEPYPRSHAARYRMLGDRIEEIGFERGRAVWDPFYELDDLFYEGLDDSLYDPAADSWLQEVCGIRSLRQLPSGAVDNVLFTNQFVRAFWQDAIRIPDDDPIEHSLEDVLRMVQHRAIPADKAQAFRIRMVSPFCEPLLVTFRRVGPEWAATEFQAGDENLLEGLAADKNRARLTRVFESCRTSLMIPRD